MKQRIFLIAIALIGILFVGQMVWNNSSYAAAREAASASYISERANQQAREEQVAVKREAEEKAKREAEAKAVQDAIDEQETARMRKLNAAGRLKEGKQSLSKCVKRGECNTSLNELKAAASTSKESDTIDTFIAAQNASRIAKSREPSDMTKLDREIIKTIGNAIGNSQGINALPSTTYGEADKDPDAARGLAIEMSGRVVEIYKIDMGYEAIISYWGKTVKVFSPYSTDGIVQGSWVTARGIFVQRYMYENVANGHTKCLVLVGNIWKPVYEYYE